MKDLPWWGKNHSTRFFFGLFLIYLIFMNPSPDTSYTIPQLHLAVSLVDQRSVALSTYRGRDVALYKGHFLSGHPPGAAFLAAGIYQIFRPLFPSRADERTIFWLNTLSVVLISIPLGVFAALVFLRLVQTMTAGSPAIGWALVFMALGTASFAYSGAFYKKGIAGSVALLVVFLVWPRPGRETSGESRDELPATRLLLAGLLAGICVLLEYTLVVLFPFLIVYLLRRRVSPGRIVWFLIGGAIMALVLFLYHQAAFGHPFRTSYSFRFHPGDAPFLLGFSPLRFWRSLFGVQCGLFLYTPVLFVSAARWGIAVRGRMLREEMIWLVGAPSLAYMMLYAFWSTVYWCGGESLIVRMMVPLFPLIMVPVAVGLGKTPRAISRTLGALSLIFAFLGAQSFFFTAESFPVVYAAKNAIASLGSGELFSRFLPRLIGVETPLSIPGQICYTRVDCQAFETSGSCSRPIRYHGSSH